MSKNVANFPNTAWDGLTPTRLDRQPNRSPDYEDWDQISAEVIAMQTPETPGAVAGTGVSHTTVAGQIIKTTITIDALSITVTDATTNGAHGTQKIFDFPECLVGILGVVGDLTITAGAGGIGDTAALIASLGTAAVGTNNDTLTSTEADIVASTAATLSSGEGTAEMRKATVSLHDGTDTPIDMHLNIAVPDAGSSANDTVTVNGTLTIHWMNLGNN